MQAWHARIPASSESSFERPFDCLWRLCEPAWSSFSSVTVKQGNFESKFLFFPGITCCHAGQVYIKVTSMRPAFHMPKSFSLRWWILNKSSLWANDLHTTCTHISKTRYQAVVGYILKGDCIVLLHFEQESYLLILFSMGQFLSVHSFLIEAMTWYSGFFLLSFVTHSAWDIWPIGKDLDLSFIWGHHHLHLMDMDDQSINRLLHYLLHRADETQQGRNSCPWLQFLAFSLDSICHCPLSFLRSFSLASLFSSLNYFYAPSI